MMMRAHAAVGRSQAGPATNHTLVGDIRRGRAVIGWGGSGGGGVGVVGAVGTFPPRNCVPAHAGMVDEARDGEVDVRAHGTSGSAVIGGGGYVPVASLRESRY